MASFKLPCPSCEHQVPIKSEKAIGTKVECPKCKYRFKAEEPAGGIPKDTEKADKAEKKKKLAVSPDAAGGKKKSKKLAVIVGVMAVAVLAAVGFAVIGGGGSDPKPKPRPNFNPTPNPKTNPGDPKEEPVEPKKEVEPPKKPTATPSDKDASNLLPGQTVALYRFDVEKIKLTPASFFFDQNSLKMFSGSFGIDADQVSLYYHAFVGSSRDPFGVVRLKSPVFEKDIVAGIAPTTASKSVKKKWTLYAFKSNPFANAVSNAFHFDSLFAEVYEKLPSSAVKTATGPRVIGFCVYDSQHIFIGDHAQLDSFLSGLDAKGLPKAQSAVGTPPPGVIQAENPLFLSIDPKLKRAMKDLGGEASTPPLFLYSEKTVQGLYDPKLLKTEFQPITAILDPILTRAQYISASVSMFTTYGLSTSIRLVMDSDTAAFEVVRDQLVPNLQLAAWGTGMFLNTVVEPRNFTTVGMMTPEIGPGGTQPPIGPAPGPGGMQPPIGPGTQPPIGPGGVQPPIGPGGVQPLIDPNKPQPTAPSHIALSMTDKYVTIAAELNWTAETYRLKLEPRLVGVVNTIKGKMAVFASDLSYHGLIAAVPKMTAPPSGHFPRGTAERKLTDVSRMGLRHQPNTRVSLFAELLPFMGRDGLSRMIDRNAAWYENDLKANIRNLEAGEAWVPELLVPAYPQSSWRATSPFVADGRILGGTNYVAIAGKDINAARFDPTKPENAKKMGMVGYDWGSKVDEVKDGLSNTIFLMQTPPGLSQPWIAGGGATVRGLDAAEPMRGLSHKYGTPAGKDGTYVLMGDGSVRFVPANINPKVILAMSTRAGDDGADLGNLDKAAERVDIPKPADAELKTDPKPTEPKKDPKTEAVNTGDLKKEPAPAPTEKK
ncbi:MAG: hypothetical protein C0467_16365 [Planctomycetaceae bacterium]|nr:hypothetical protein [Planctomycetaceae bacterium]